MSINIDDLEFVPICEFTRCGSTTQRCETKVNGIRLTWETYFPFNIFKEPTDNFILDLIVPVGKIENGFVSENYYTEPGFGLPVFKTLEHAVEFAETFKKAAIMKELKIPFEVIDMFAGSPPIDLYYEDAVKLAEAKGYTFTSELWHEACQMVGMP